MVNVDDTVYVLCLSQRRFCNGKLVEFSEKCNKVLGVFKEYSDAIEAVWEYCELDSTEFKDEKLLDDKLQRWYKSKIGYDVCEDIEILCRTVR